MSDQFALGLLSQMLEKLQQEVEALTLRVEELEAIASEEEGGRYLDGSPVR